MPRVSIIALAAVLVLSATGPLAAGTAATDATVPRTGVADAGAADGQDEHHNGTLALNATTVAPDGTIRFTVTATSGPVQFFTIPPYSVQRRVRGEWKSLSGAVTPALPEPIERGESQSWTWSPRRLSDPVRPGEYRVVFRGRSGELVDRFRVVGGNPTPAIRSTRAAVARNGTTTRDAVAHTAPSVATVDVTAVNDAARSTLTVVHAPRPTTRGRAIDVKTS